MKFLTHVDILGHDDAPKLLGLTLANSVLSKAIEGASEDAVLIGAPLRVIQHRGES